MEHILENIYKTARKNTGFTQEDVAGFLNTSVDTISNYERYNSTPDAETVFRLAKLYKAEWLIWAHLTMCTEYGKILPEIKLLNDMCQAWMQVESAQDDFSDISREARKIIGDGKITKEERIECDSVIERAMRVASACLSLCISLRTEEQRGDRQ